MKIPEVPEPRGLGPRLLNRAEEWIYELNQRGHWLFTLYDFGNELWARLVFRGVRRRAAAFEATVAGREDAAQLRMFRAGEDDDAFAALLGELSQFKYRPPHPLDAASARRALRRRSYLPFGLFHDGELVGYLLIRLFFPRRAATGIWSRELAHNKGFSTNAVATTAGFTSSEGIADYITVPLDNVYSLRGALTAGWRIVRKNRRFYVLLHE